jgi:hypothetical protein
MLLTILLESKGTQKQTYTLRENTKLVSGQVVHIRCLCVCQIYDQELPHFDR